MIKVRVLSAFRYPLNGYIKWIMKDDEIELPAHAAAELNRQKKVEYIKEESK